MSLMARPDKHRIPKVQVLEVHGMAPGWFGRRHGVPVLSAGERSGSPSVSVSR